jgi:hypothetical protein
MPSAKVSLPPDDLTVHTIDTPGQSMNLSELLTQLETLSLNALRQLVTAVMQLILTKLMGTIA